MVDGSTAGAPIAVPEEGLAISGGTLYGIDKTWFANVNPDKGKVYLAISIPSGVTEINNDGLKDSYTSDKKLHNAVTYMDGLGSFSVAALSFDDATGLETIGEQALQGNSQLTGILDLSATNVSVIKKSAFSGCSNLTGVVLPKTLKELGSRSSSAGSVFNGCEGLRYIRVAGSSNQNAVFELPEGLTYIGRQTFKNCFASDVDAKVIIPASVETIGSEAFYSKRISQIIIQKEGDGWDPRLTGYDTSAFKTGNDDLLVVFLNRKSYVDYTVGRSFTGAVKRALSYPVTLTFQNAKEGVIKQDKLNYQSIQYEYDEAAGFWAVNQDYLLPQPAGEQVSKPGYNTFWTVDDKKLTDSGKINITSDNPTVEIDYVIQNPTIQPVADGTVQADFHTLSIDLDAAGPHTVGVQVSHPLLKEQQGTEDTYVYFQYCWWDESGEESGVNGPRSRAEPELFSSSAENGILNRVKTGNAVIPIDGQEHARTDGHYYMVEIYGYLVENGGTPELFYKSHHNFIDFGSDSDTEATVSRSYTLQVEVTQVERHAVLFQTGEHGTLEGTSNFAVKDGSTMRKSGYPVPSVAADSGYSFTGWLGTDGITRTSNEVLDLTVTGDMTFTAQYAKDSGSGGSTGSRSRRTPSRHDERHRRPDYSNRSRTAMSTVPGNPALPAPLAPAMHPGDRDTHLDLDDLIDHSHEATQQASAGAQHPTRRWKRGVGRKSKTRKPRNPDAVMPLADHLVEFRKRFVRAIAGIIIMSIVGWMFSDQVFRILQQPFLTAAGQQQGLMSITFNGVVSAFNVKLEIAFFLGLTASCPWWSYQVWAFIN
ncbi:MAG: twin-arginine translocase subunit TatC, partial [Collinsella sp.]|nr:twin-arginine translocase subunit TatC [Collinsella sp.]